MSCAETCLRCLTLPVCRLTVSLVGTAALMTSCAAPDVVPPATEHATGMGVLEGWQQCVTDNCGRNFISVYSKFVFLRLDATPLYGSPVARTEPGRHWIEAHYAWGAGIIVGVGNYRNYGFELDFLPDHRYRIKEVPGGCIVPASSHWVSPKTLLVEDSAPTGETIVREVKAMEYCSPSGEESGTCRQDGDCRSGTCTPFGGTTGFGLCGVLR